MEGERLRTRRTVRPEEEKSKQEMCNIILSPGTLTSETNVTSRY